MGCEREKNVSARGVEVIEVKRRQATVAWITETPARGKVFFRRAAGAGEPETAVENLSKSFRHQVILPNLTPGTRYTYWISDPHARFQFQTQPEANTPFSFCLVSGTNRKTIEQTVMTEIPDFLVDTSRAGPGEKDVFQGIRPYVPVFDFQGRQSPFLEDQQKKPTELWPLDWGELRLWVATGIQALENLPENSTVGLQGVMWAPKDLSVFVDGLDVLKTSSFYQALLRYNQGRENGQIEFALVPAKTAWHGTAGKIRFLGLPMAGEPSRVRMDVGTRSLAAVFLDTGMQVFLKEPPLKEKISCDDCRKLADQGAYKAAIEAYKNFIRNNAGHFQVDDAYFAVARLYDEKLFDFKPAIHWYEILLQQEAISSLAPLARQRIRFLKDRSDFDFIPLAQFERIKKIEVPIKRNQPGEMGKALEKARAIASTYPAAVIAPDLLHWLGMQYRDLDTALSVGAFQQLLKQYPESGAAGSARTDIGDTYYRAGEYFKARHAYEKALAHAHNPGLTGTINAQIKRCSRNILRMRFAEAAGAAMAVASFIIFVLRPRGIPLKIVRRGGLAGVCLLGTNFLAAWVIQEQFVSTAEMAGLVVCFSLASAWAGICGAALFDKLTRFSQDRFLARFLANLCGICSGLVLFGAGFYLSVFYINKHYLIIFKL